MKRFDTRPRVAQKKVVGQKIQNTAQGQSSKC